MAAVPDDDYDEEDEDELGAPLPAKAPPRSGGHAGAGGEASAGAKAGASKGGKGKSKRATAAVQSKKGSSKAGQGGAKNRGSLDDLAEEGEDEVKEGVGKDVNDETEVPGTAKGTNASGKEEEEDEEEGDTNLDLDTSKFPTMTGQQMQAVLEKFTPEQMSRYECYRRSGFQRSTMKKFLQIVAGCPVNVQMAIVMSGITKIFVGELVEMARVVMSERGDHGPIRPSHMRESYRRLKQQGKVPLTTKPSLFR